MISQLLLALALVGATVTLHALASVLVVMPMADMWTRRANRAGVLNPMLMLTRLASGLLILHLTEMMIWAAAYTGFGIMPDFETSLYYSLTSYTTVGYGDVLPPSSWRLLGPIEAAAGVLMLGWSTSIIVAAVQRINIGRRDESDTDKHT